MTMTDRDRTRSVPMTRRGVVTGAVATVAAGVSGGDVLAQVASPMASPVAVDPEAFRALCLAVTGAERLDDDGLSLLLGMIEADEEMAGALPVLLATPLPETFKVWDFELPQVMVLTAILQFWYLGEFRNAPIANREQMVGRLVSYQALPYFTAQGVCKAFGYWAEDPGVT